MEGSYNKVNQLTQGLLRLEKRETSLKMEGFCEKCLKMEGFCEKCLKMEGFCEKSLKIVSFYEKF